MTEPTPPQREQTAEEARVQEARAAGSLPDDRLAWLLTHSYMYPRDAVQLAVEVQATRARRCGDCVHGHCTAWEVQICDDPPVPGAKWWCARFTPDPDYPFEVTEDWHCADFHAREDT